MIWKRVRDLKNAGVVGVNARNATYVLPHNARHLQAAVNCKLQTKRLAQEVGIKVPELFGAISVNGEVSKLRNILEGRDSFAIKPAHGAGGDGILVVTGQVNGYWRMAGGRMLETADLQFHLSNVLSGMYSLGGQPDTAFIEDFVDVDPVFAEIAWGGVPDIRVLVYRGVPAMAMARLPTAASGGKANLHKGGLGAGVDISSGVTTTAVCNDHAVQCHPDTGKDIAGVAVPHWEEMMHMSARAQEITQLDYLGVDIVLDRLQGPLLLELNARPGLAIQIANNTGQRHRLDAIDQAIDDLPDVESRVAFAQERLGSGKRPPEPGEWTAPVGRLGLMAAK
ncbi:alpha-L-glutamate ligase-like protein [Rhodovibrio salinarum]|uniref:Alpha-L-glutamate ligase-like protein n=1 Tax=Rhodovibrio salinarum TaxID=1087 RepID=A0A934QFX8_9PROT|nr:alpha-L-glutamate ligase-like protein [Rhodovibrio salinarum]MBK1695912.1 alpha-L-glutamate ligase-like protein [Rhodovibrio salinarum]